MVAEEEIEIVTTKRNSLFRFDEDVDYKDLVDIFPELLRHFLDVSDQYPEEEGEEFVEMLIRQNLKDLKNNRKPMGYNREARYRMIFPVDRERVEFFIYPRIPEEESEIEDVVSEISGLLEENDLPHEIIWDEMEYLKEEKD